MIQSKQIDDKFFLKTIVYIMTFGIRLMNPLAKPMKENRLKIDCSDPEQLDQTIDFLKIGDEEGNKIKKTLQHNHLSQLEKNVLFCMLGIDITMSPKEILTQLEKADQKGLIQILKDMSITSVFKVRDARLIAEKLAGCVSGFMSNNLVGALTNLIEFMIQDCLITIDQRRNVIKNYQLDYPYKSGNQIGVFLFKIVFSSEMNQYRIACCSCQTKPLNLDNCSVIFQIDDLDSMVKLHRKEKCQCLTRPQEFIINGLKKSCSNHFQCIDEVEPSDCKETECAPQEDD